MFVKYSFIFLLVRQALAVPVNTEDPSNYVFEEEIMKILEDLRKIMKEGDSENKIPPLEPLRLPKAEINFYLDQTDLTGMLRNVVVANLSDFKVRNLTVNLSPKMEVKLKVSFDEVHISGSYDLRGVLFGEYPVKGVGKYRTDLKGLTLSAEACLRSKGGIPNVRHLNVTFDLQGISVFYKNFLEGDREESLNQEFLFHLLHRFRGEYLPSLLNTLKIIINDFLVRDEDTVLSKYLNAFVNRIN